MTWTPLVAIIRSQHICQKTLGMLRREGRPETWVGPLLIFLLLLASVWAAGLGRQAKLENALSGEEREASVAPLRVAAAPQN